MNDDQQIDNSSEGLGSGLVYEGSLPLAWRVLVAEPTAGELASQQLANQEVLHAVLGLEETYATSSEEHPAGTPPQELERLEFKLNMLLELVGQMLSHHVGLPVEQPVRMSSKRLEWRSDKPPVLDHPVRAEIFLHPTFPRPLVFTGRSVESLEESYNAALVLDPLTDAVQESFDKFIFRHHRRLVAQARRSTTAKKPPPPTPTVGEKGI